MASSSPFDGMTPTERAERIAELMKASEKLEAFNRYLKYDPYDKQRQFHAKSSVYNLILLMGGNQLGKTFCGAMEMTYHLTGLYPDWWQGKRFPYPIKAIAGSVTFEMTMAGIQRNLLGNPVDKATWGTAALPKSCIVETFSSGQPKGFVDRIVVKHASGLGNSVLKLTCYAKGREAWQADKADLVWFDEEPPFDVFDEGVTRLRVGSGPDYGFPELRGHAYMTFTPLSGMSNVVKSFYPAPDTANKTFVQLGIRDVKHFSAEEVEKILSEYPAHTRDARAFGIPVLGEGAIFNFGWDNIVIKPMEIPDHYFRISGIDFGINHPSAAVEIAEDRDNDVIYVLRCHRESGLNSAEFASRVRLWGGRWAWPHDGAAHEKGSGETLADQYKGHGLDMLPERATHDGKSNSLEASIMDVNDRFKSGRLFIFDNPGNRMLLDELQQYHRKDGKPVPIYDDALSAMRYAIMMKRFGVQRRAKPELSKRLAGLNGYARCGNLVRNGSFMSN